MSELSDIRALLIEPHQGMRVSLHNMLNLCGITKIEHALTAGTAVRTIKAKVFDLVLCEYDLVVGQDGQQLLGDVRHHKLTPLSTIFIMVTAERAYAKVVSAAELAPSDYLLKPFTADTLLERVMRALEKRKAFVDVHRFMESGAVSEAIAASHHGERDYPKYAVDFMRLRAELHVVLGEATEAEALYKLLFELKAVAWARLGLAKTLFMQGKYQEAEAILKKLVAENNKFMDAYDWLAKTHEMIGELPEAKEVLDTAVAVSPHAVRRLRNLGRIAMETGDIETAETVFKKVVSKAKFSEFRDPEDHLNLVNALVKKGDTDQAKTVIRDMEKNMSGLKKTEACRENDKEGAASEIVLGVMKNASNQRMISKAVGIFESAGKGMLGKELAQRSQREVMDLVALGVQKAKQGDFRGSVDLMTAAAHKSPDNPQVVLNAALAALKCLENMGWDSAIGEQAKDLIEAGRRLDPMNPRLKAIRGLYDELQKKYGMSVNRMAKT